MPDIELPPALLWIAAAGAIAYAIRNIGWAAHRLGIDRLMARLLAAAIQPLADRLDARITEVLDEVRPNGGSSMRDAVDRVETKLDRHIDGSALDRSDLRRWLETLDPGRHSDPHIADHDDTETP